MNAEAVISILLGETNADEFVGSLPKDFFVSFHVIHDREDNVHADDGYRQHDLVYKNNADGKTRDFIGYLVQASNMKYYPSGVARPQPGSPTRVDKLDWEAVAHLGTEDRDAAARRLWAIFVEANG